MGKVWNNIVYDFSSGVGIFNSDGTAYGYNNSVYNANNGYWNYSGTFVAKNNIAQSSATNGYNGTFSNSEYNISDKADAPGTGSKNSTTVTFAGAGDYHLANNDTQAKGAGTDLKGALSLADRATLFVGQLQHFTAMLSHHVLPGDSGHLLHAGIGIRDLALGIENHDAFRAVAQKTIDRVRFL